MPGPVASSPPARYPSSPESYTEEVNAEVNVRHLGREKIKLTRDFCNSLEMLQLFSVFFSPSRHQTGC